MRPIFSRSNFSKKTSATHGFTLVELLVVIGIIAVLISILLPALSKARKQAQAVACESNMRQLITGLIMYAGSSKGMLPYDNLSGSPDTAAWFNRVSTVTGLAIIDVKKHDATVWSCPVAVNDGFARLDMQGAIVNNVDTLYSNSVDYSINENLCGTTDNSQTVTNMVKPCVKLSKVKNSTAVLADGSMYFQSYYKTWVFGTTFNEKFNAAQGNYGINAPWPVNFAPDLQAGKVTKKHNGRVSVGFIDGHVETVKDWKSSLVIPPTY